jgi:AcrR family transcriptional regulator
VTRTYQKKKRLEREAETRQRIVDAAVELHTSVGPARTSIAAVAREAGVQRHTVYAHFPDEPSLFRACGAHWALLHPFPDEATWSRVADPRGRLQRALREVYRWYEEVEPDVALFIRDAASSPSVAAQWEEWAGDLRRLADSLAAPLGGSRTVRAAVGHALAFETWRSLVRHEGLTTARAVRAMSSFVANV